MKALFLGLGGVGQRHLRNLLQLMPDTEIAAVRHSNQLFEIKDDLSINKTVSIIDKYNIKLLVDLDQAINWSPDFAIVSTPSHYHVTPTTALIKNDIPVLMEKPISHDWEGLEELLKSVNDSNAFIMIAYMLRFHPGIQQLFSVLKEKKIGKIYSAQITLCSHMPSWHPYENYEDLYAGRKDYGGGVILTAIHPIDLLYFMFGLPISLYSIGGKVSDYNIDVEDTVITIFEYESYGLKFPVSLNMSFVERPGEHSISIWGEKGKLYWDEITGCFSFCHVENKEKSIINKNSEFKRNDMFISEMKHFLDCVKYKKKPISNLSDVIDGHKIALRMKESLEGKKILLF